MPATLRACFRYIAMDLMREATLVVMMNTKLHWHKVDQASQQITFMASVY